MRVYFRKRRTHAIDRMAKEQERDPAGAKLVALLRDLAQNQAQITDTQRLVEETLKKLAENKISGEQNGHNADSVVGKSHPHPASSRPSMPNFPPRTETHHWERLPTFEEIREDWRNANLEEDISYKDYADLRMRDAGGGNRGGYFNDDLRRKLSKVNLSPFDGSGSISTQAWVMKADTYFQLNPMPKEAIKFSTLHSKGVAHEWWHHDTITLGHDQIKSYAEFTKRLIERFDEKDPELNFIDLVQLR